MKKFALVSLIGSILVAGFVSGLVVSGRMSLSQPAESAQAAQARPAGAFPPLNGLPDLSPVAERALQVAANISSTTTIRPANDMLSRFLYGDLPSQSKSLGSGVVVSPDGYVLTNNHVIGNAGAEIRVTLPDGRERPAKLVGIDEVTDLAVVKVDAQGLQTLPWGDSSKLRVAEWVLAIGNPYQFSGTVTLGIVSTVSRSGAQVGAYADFIQTDAAINPGNSGGALVNNRGELVGINTMIYSDTGGYQGIGFAIPSNLAQRIMDELIKHGEIPWGSVGEVQWVTMTPRIAERYGLRSTTGALIFRLATVSAAARAGLQVGDVVTAMNGKPIADADQLDRMIVTSEVSQPATFEIDRGGRKRTVQVTIVSRRQGAVRR